MTTWARVVDGKVVEVVAVDPAGRFHPELEWRIVPDGTVQNATVNADGSLTAPPPSPPDPPLPRATVMAVTDLEMLFTLPELTAIRTSTDPDVSAGWAVVSNPGRTVIDLGAPLMVGWFQALVTRGILTADRSTAIAGEGG